MLLSCANTLIVRDQWTTIASSAYIFIKNILLILLLIIIIIIVIIIIIIIIIVVITTSILLSKSNCATKPFHLAKQTSA